ncbi:MAG TPA: FtsQ-type POTRA domain-containing protein [Nitrospira sp.]|nr:FtsQ-type POTRA domain-containing protein [Nitrospira sp.]
MKIPFRKRPTKAAGHRMNQWKGPRAMQAAELRQQVRRTQLAVKCRRALRLTGWILGATIIVAVGVAGSRALGPVIQRGLEIRNVRVEGIHQVTIQDILNQLALKKGIALHQVSLSYLAERLQTHPWIKEATVERLPLHELRVTVLERKPAAVARIGSEHFLTDDGGAVLARLGARDDATLPLLTGLDAKVLLQGDRHLRQTIQSSIELAKAMAQSVDGRVEIELGNPVGLIASAKGVRFQFGSDALMDQWDRFTKVKAVSRATTFEGRKREVTEVDLRYDNRVIFRERG